MSAPASTINPLYSIRCCVRLAVVMTGSAEQHVRDEVAALLTAVPLPRPWHIDQWIDRLEVWRGRPIDLVAFDYRPGSPSGAYHADADTDLIAYPQGVPSMHQDHIILHESAHMVFGHSGDCTLSLAEAQRRCPTLAPAAFAHMLPRSGGDQDELDAELAAVLLMVEVTRISEQLYKPGPRSLAARFTEVFG